MKSNAATDLNMTPVYIHRWATRVHERDAKAHRAALSSVLEIIQSEARTPRTLADAARDLEARRTLLACFDGATAHAALTEDVRLALSRGWWRTFMVLAGEAVDVRLVSA